MDYIKVGKGKIITVKKFHVNEGGIAVDKNGNISVSTDGQVWYCSGNIQVIDILKSLFAEIK